jgi:lipopolysaccharide/colanic/teichoic acid biosynthesis glycosyltransferase
VSSSVLAEIGEMKIVVTGASGFVSKNLVPLLKDAGAELLLVGRSPQRLECDFPGHSCCGYEDLVARGKGYDLLLHLAVANNDATVPPEMVHSVNVEFMLQTLEAAKQAGIARFLNVSSVHALDPRNQTPYAQSKREAEKRLETVTGIDAITVYLPIVHANSWCGKLAVLNRLPRPLANTLFRPLAALTPTVHVGRIASFLLDLDAVDRGGEIILFDDQNENFVFCTTKRAVDLLFALSVAALFWWGLMLTWALIRLQSPGPSIFAQERIGRDGRSFTCYKFRTMKLGTVQAGTHEVSAQAVMPLGRFLRKTKLDELPQIWNILRNDISLIGPRPCLPVQTQLIEARRARNVLSLKPGITGLAQINGIDMSDPEKLARWDARYVALRSLLLDLRIIIATATGRGQGDKVQK